MQNSDAIVAELKRVRQKAKGAILARFFKTGKGQYGEGDVFWGITVPAQRAIAKKFFSTTTEKDLRTLLKNPVHEVRLTATLILVYQFARASETEKAKIARFYLRMRSSINNWDLVDVSSPRILGEYYASRSRAPLYKLARSRILWERRIAILTTLYFIQQGDFADTFAISQLLLHDKEDLIHKAVGWMLREVGKKNSAQLIGFLKKYYPDLPRTTLRYAIERFPENTRSRYRNGKFN